MNASACDVKVFTRKGWDVFSEFEIVKAHPNFMAGWAKFDVVKHLYPEELQN